MNSLTTLTVVAAYVTAASRAYDPNTCHYGHGGNCDLDKEPSPLYAKHERDEWLKEITTADCCMLDVARVSVVYDSITRKNQTEGNLLCIAGYNATRHASGCKTSETQRCHAIAIEAMDNKADSILSRRKGEEPKDMKKLLELARKREQKLTCSKKPFSNYCDVIPARPYRNHK